MDQGVTEKQIKQKWGTSEVWNLYNSKSSNQNNNSGGSHPSSYYQWSNNSQRVSASQGFIQGNQWGSPFTWNNQAYFQQTNPNQWGHPNQWQSPINSQAQEPRQQYPHGNTSISNISPAKCSSAPQNQIHSISSNGSWKVGFQPIPNISWSQIPQKDLKGGEYFEHLKKNGIDDEIICLLCNQGIDSLKLLRECSQEALVAVGIKLAQAIKLKKL